MIVVDLGCKPWKNDESVHTLVERFTPDILFGFDPHPETQDGVSRIKDTIAVISRKAAWTKDGWVKVSEAGIGTYVSSASIPSGGELRVQCFDLASFLLALAPTELVVKMDVEGAEYPLLNRIRFLDVDKVITLLLVEWHTGKLANGYEGRKPDLRCPVEGWY